jgi:hypothetical protein
VPNVQTRFSLIAEKQGKAEHVRGQSANLLQLCLEGLKCQTKASGSFILFVLRHGLAM